MGSQLESAFSFANPSSLSTVQSIFVYTIVGVVFLVVLTVCSVSRRLRRRRSDVLTAAVGHAAVKRNGDDDALPEIHAWHARDTDASDLSWDRDDVERSVNVPATAVAIGSGKASRGLANPRDTSTSDADAAPNNAMRANARSLSPEDFLDETAGNAIWDRSSSSSDSQNNDEDITGANNAQAQLTRALSPSDWVDQREEYSTSDDCTSVGAASESAKELVENEGGIRRLATSMKSAKAWVEAMDDHHELVHKGAVRRATTAVVTESAVRDEATGLRRAATYVAAASKTGERDTQLMVRGISIGSRISAGAGRLDTGQISLGDVDEPKAQGDDAESTMYDFASPGPAMGVAFQRSEPILYDLASPRRGTTYANEEMEDTEAHDAEDYVLCEGSLDHDLVPDDAMGAEVVEPQHAVDITRENDNMSQHDLSTVAEEPSEFNSRVGDDNDNNDDDNNNNNNNNNNNSDNEDEYIETSLVPATLYGTLTTNTLTSAAPTTAPASTLRETLSDNGDAPTQSSEQTHSGNEDETAWVPKPSMAPTETGGGEEDKGWATRPSIAPTDAEEAVWAPRPSVSTTDADGMFQVESSDHSAWVTQSTSDANAEEREAVATRTVGQKWVAQHSLASSSDNDGRTVYQPITRIVVAGAKPTLDDDDDTDNDEAFGEEDCIVPSNGEESEWIANPTTASTDEGGEHHVGDLSFRFESPCDDASANTPSTLRRAATAAAPPRHSKVTTKDGGMRRAMTAAERAGSSENLAALRRQREHDSLVSKFRATMMTSPNQSKGGSALQTPAVTKERPSQLNAAKSSWL